MYGYSAGKERVEDQNEKPTRKKSEGQANKSSKEMTL